MTVVILILAWLWNIIIMEVGIAKEEVGVQEVIEEEVEDVATEEKVMMVKATENEGTIGEVIATMMEKRKVWESFITKSWFSIAYQMCGNVLFLHRPIQGY